MAGPASLYSQYEVSSNVCYQIPPMWKLADEIASSSVGKITANGKDLGCGVLIGIDRVLVPAHVIAGKCSDDLQVNFLSHYFCSSYWAVTFFVDEALDLAILQLERGGGRFPGEVRYFPRLNVGIPPQQFLLGRFDGEFPNSAILERGQLCYDGNFCSFASTRQGCSGSGYFDQDGNLFALHLSRSNDSCAGVPKGERKAVLVSQMIQSPQLGWIFSLPLCRPLCPPPMPVVCAPDFYRQESCFVEEKKSGGRPAETREIKIFGRTHKFWEYRPKNPNGDGPRGLTMSVPHQRQKVTYRFVEQPHDIRAYNKNPEPLYETAAKAFKAVFETTGDAPEAFTFHSHLGPFEATKIQVESFS